MTGRQRCDEILRIIDQVLADSSSPGDGPEKEHPRPELDSRYQRPG